MHMDCLQDTRICIEPPVDKMEELLSLPAIERSRWTADGEGGSAFIKIIQPWLQRSKVESILPKFMVGLRRACG